MDERPRIKEVSIEEEMRKSFIDYAMSVIVARALPDVRDGLKPVHRRILYSMQELGLSPDKPFRKSARIVGDVLGKYHPHGDSAVYDAMVRMAQDFSIRAPLVEGHGNFGSVDGDSAAAIRYTEARLSKVATEMLRDINKDTVDFRPNFDETLKEPDVLPCRFPNLLVNGSSGIAVGMATNIPPHNMGEVIDGVVALIDDADADIETILTHIKGPDFPTGGIIQGKAGLRAAYYTGRGRIVTRAKAEIEELTGGRSRILVTEIPYQVNKARLIEKIAELVREKRITGISHINDESDRSGMRIVIDIKKDVNPNVVLNQLYKHTQMQETFGVIMLALVDGKPKILNIREVLSLYLDHQKDVVTRRTKYDLAKAEARAHILEGLLIALDHIDEVIKLIRGSKDDAAAKEGLMSRFGLSEKQAVAILDMRLRRLTGLEREKIEEEYAEIEKTIEYLKKILADEGMLLAVIKEELLEIKEKYNDPRRTQINPIAGEIDVEDLIEEEEVVVTLTHFGYVKRMPLDTYRSQHRGGKGIVGLQTREEDFVEHIFTASTHRSLLFFSSRGKVYSMKAYEIPQAGRTARGTAIINLLQLMPGETIQAVIPVEEFREDHYLVIATKQGLIKKTPLPEYENIRVTGKNAITLREGDVVVGVMLTDGQCEIILASLSGKAIRFHEGDVRPMGRTAMGVKGMDIDADDAIIGMERIIPDLDILVITEEGYGKRTSETEYRSQNRGGKGILTLNVTEKTGHVVAMKVVEDADDLMIINSQGIIIRISAAGISRMGRNTQGVRLMRITDGQKVVSVARVREEENTGEIEEESGNGEPVAEDADTLDQHE